MHFLLHQAPKNNPKASSINDEPLKKISSENLILQPINIQIDPVTTGCEDEEEGALHQCKVLEEAQHFAPPPGTSVTSGKKFVLNLEFKWNLNGIA